MKKLYLVDVSSMYFRAYYAIRPLSNSQGMPTNALYGFLSMVVKLLKKEKPDYLGFCFDNKEPSFRKELYSEYKANRTEMPEDLVPQVPYVRKISEALGIPVFNQIGFEADDLIGALTQYGREQNLEVIIVSGDKDFGQLIQPYVSMYDTMKEIRYDVDGVQEKWGIPPEQFIDYLALVGDSSDNIPGVKGIGPKGAQKLLAQYKTLEEIYENVDEVGPKGTQKKLKESKEMAFLSKELVTIATDIDLVKDLDELKMKEVHREELKQLLEELDFKSFEKNLLGSDDGGSKSKEAERSRSSNEPSLEEKSGATDQFKSSIQFEEIEATYNVLEKEIKENDSIWCVWSERGLYLASEAAKKVYIVSGKPEDIGQVLEKKKIKWLGYDLKKIWKDFGVSSPIGEWDLMLASYVLKAGAAESFEDLYQKYAGGKVPEIPTATQWFQCHIELRRRVEERLKEKDNKSILQSLELPLASILFQMEKSGILVDLKELSSQSELLKTDIAKLEEKIQEIAGEKFNVASTKQLSAILFDKMGIPPIKKIKTGYSTDNDVLEKLSEEHEIAKLVIEFRELSKLKSTYVDALPLLVNPKTERIHTTFSQAHTATGRLSSHDPNLQNIPIRTERGNRVRRAFVAQEGFELVSVDYSQIELRILAHITGDEGLCEAFRKGHDIHAATASQIFAVPLEEVSSDQRRSAKAVNFGIAYGQGPFGLAENLKISRKEASEIISQYFARFSRVKDYMIEVIETGKKQGYVETIFGRRRYLEELNSKNGRIRKFGERAAINAPVQGAASDIVKKAMIEVQKAKVPGLLLQVHDELLFEINSSEVEQQTQKICDIMENVVELEVPLKVNSARGKNWEEAHG